MNSNGPAGRFELEWSQVLPIGAGLVNWGNTCYANSVLQCLTYTPPLANYMLTGEHSRTCGENGFCMMCAMEKHITKVLRRTGSVVKPIAELSQLNLIRQQYEHGLQQDAHEFLNYILRAMHQSCLSGCRLNGQMMDMSLVQEVFEGHLRATTSCSSCGAVSQALEPYRDIAVGIKDASNVPQALRWHLEPEPLGVETGYKCWKCKNIGQASRKVAFYDVSKVLVITLKRFDNHSGRVVTHVSYPETLDMRPFMSESSGEPEMYQLYGVLTHSGHNCDSGHYYCHIKASDGQWYRMNDNSVNVSDRRTALRQQAYLLFYIRSSKPDQLMNTSHQCSSNSLPGAVSTSTPVTNPKQTLKIHLPHSSTSKVAHRRKRDYTSLCHEKIGTSKDGSLTKEQSADQPPKLNRQTWDNFQSGNYKRPHRSSADCLKKPDKEKSVPERSGSEADQASPQQRKRWLVNEDDKCQEQSAERRTQNWMNRIPVKNCSTERRPEVQRCNRKRRRNQKCPQSSDGPKRARTDRSGLSFTCV